MNFGLYVPQIKMFHDFQNDKERGAALFTLNLSLFILLTTAMGALFNRYGKSAMISCGCKLIVCVESMVD